MQNSVLNSLNKQIGRASGPHKITTKSYVEANSFSLPSHFIALLFCSLASHASYQHCKLANFSSQNPFANIPNLTGNAGSTTAEDTSKLGQSLDHCPGLRLDVVKGSQSFRPIRISRLNEEGTVYEQISLRSPCPFPPLKLGGIPMRNLYNAKQMKDQVLLFNYSSFRAFLSRIPSLSHNKREG